MTIRNWREAIPACVSTILICVLWTVCVTGIVSDTQEHYSRNLTFLDVCDPILNGWFNVSDHYTLDLVNLKVDNLAVNPYQEYYRVSVTETESARILNYSFIFSWKGQYNLYWIFTRAFYFSSDDIFLSYGFRNITRYENPFNYVSTDFDNWLPIEWIFTTPIFYEGAIFYILIDR